MDTKVSILLLVILCAVQCFAEDHYVKFLQKVENGIVGKNCLILTQETIKRFKGYKDDSPMSLYISNKAAISSPDIGKLKNNEDRLIEIYGKDLAVVQAHVDLLCKSTSEVPKFEIEKLAKEPEIVKIIDGGDQGNRIDVVFMGDGYTADERLEFFDDMRRLTTDMFEGTTFRSYLPVFNIWAIYVESVTSGIGYNGPLNTPFRLYREAGQLRAIYPGDSNRARQVCKLTGTGGCDYPSIIGNDDFYGGLGGEFVISTRSNLTGTIVLRHEMGHNFVYVGEEYDNGYVYRGVNSASSVGSLGWSDWLSGEKKEERAIYRIMDYPWKDLSKGTVEYKFNSDAKYSRWYLDVSVTAAGEEDCLEFRLDGEILPWNSSGSDDRSFYDWYGSEGFTSGSHTFTISSKTKPTHPKIPRMISHVRLHEFGNEDEFHADNTYISAYPTWNANGGKTFRPTNAGCLMRNMSHPSFCNVCKEGMWQQFLQRISLIDDVRVEQDSENPEVTNVTVDTLKLGQLRNPLLPAVEGERLDVSWFRDGEEVESFKNLFKISVPTGVGSWRVQVTFVTPEVINDPQGRLRDSETFEV